MKKLLSLIFVCSGIIYGMDDQEQYQACIKKVYAHLHEGRLNDIRREQKNWITYAMLPGLKSLEGSIWGREPKCGGVLAFPSLKEGFEKCALYRNVPVKQYVQDVEAVVLQQQKNVDKEESFYSWAISTNNEVRAARLLTKEFSEYRAAIIEEIKKNPEFRWGILPDLSEFAKK